MMKKLLATTILAACALLADGQTVWRFEATEGDGERGADAAAKTQKKAPKTGDTTVLTLPGGEKMALIYCAPGEFMMGSENGERCEKPVHKVRLTYGYLDAKNCRSARRQVIQFGFVPDELIGFRICCVLPGELESR